MNASAEMVEVASLDAEHIMPAWNVFARAPGKLHCSEDAFWSARYTALLFVFNFLFVVGRRDVATLQTQTERRSGAAYL